MRETYAKGVIILDRYVPKTRFVMERLKETSWENRERIRDLINIERLILRGGPKKYNEHMVANILHRTYYVEWQCIKREIEHNEYTSPEQFKRLVREDEEETRKKLATYRQEKLQREKAEREKRVVRRKKWLEMGGVH